MIAAADNNNSRKAAPPLRGGSDFTLRRFAVGALIGLAAGLVCASIALRRIYQDTTPALTPEIFHSAHERWLNRPLADYDIEIQVTGPQASVYRVEVRAGQPQAAWRNGQPLTNRRTFGTWSIPGMFSTISRDVEAVERSAAGGAAPPLILRAEFNEMYGYPQRYRRIDNGSRKGGDSITVTWDVVDFRVVEPPRP